MSDAAELLAALDAAPDDLARAALIAGHPSEVLEELLGELAYRAMNAEVAAEWALFEAFGAALDAAADDHARLAVIDAAHRDPQRGPAFIAEWARRLRSSAP